MSSLKNVLVPDIGDFENVEVIEVNVKVGSQIKKDDPIITIESNKALMEIPAPFEGIVKRIVVHIGDRVSQGDLLLSIEAKDQGSDRVRQPRNQSREIIKPMQPAEVETKLEEPKARGTSESRLKTDQTSEIQSELPVVPLSKIKKIANKKLTRSWQTIPHVYQFVDADITKLENSRQVMNRKFSKDGLHLTYLPYIIKSVALGLKKYPIMNANLDELEESVIYKKHINIGIAIDSKDGLLVPVIADADEKDLIELSKLLVAMKEKSEQRKFKPQDFQGGTFTITNLGKFPVGNFTPIINWPEVAILGVSAAKVCPSYEKNKIEPRLILPLSLSYDHRVIDGALAAEFIAFVAEGLSKE